MAGRHHRGDVGGIEECTFRRPDNPDQVFFSAVTRRGGLLCDGRQIYKHKRSTDFVVMRLCADNPCSSEEGRQPRNLTLQGWPLQTWFAALTSTTISSGEF